MAPSARRSWAPPSPQIDPCRFHLKTLTDSDTGPYTARHMWPWKRDSLGTVTRRLDDMESDLKRLRLEWNDVLDRLERIAGRLAKRAQRETPVLTGPEAGGDHAPPPPPASRAMLDVLKRRGVR